MMVQGWLTNQRFIFVPAALGLLLPALFLPWIGINFLGTSEFSPVDMIASAFWNDNGKSANQESRFDLQNFISSYEDTFFVFLASLVLIMTSVAVMAAAVPFQLRRSELALVAGILAIASSMSWLFAVESLRNDFAEQAAMTGGIIGEEFRGHERSLADIIIMVGFGPYVALAGGAIGILAFITERAKIHKN